MKTTVVGFLWVSLMVASLSSRASAEPVVSESFEYVAGTNLDTLDGGTGFDGAWRSTISHGRPFVVGLTDFSGGASTILTEESGLSFGELPVAGTALSRFGSAGRAQANRTLSEEARAALFGDGTTMWFSVLFAGSAGGFKHGTFVIGTDKLSREGRPVLGDGSNDRNPPFEPIDGDGFGFTLQSAPDGSAQGTGSINALAFDGSSFPLVVEGSFVPLEGADPNHQEPTLVVGKIVWNPAGTPDVFHLFSVTDLSEEPSEGDAIASVTDLDLDQSAFDTVAMWDSNHSIFDEIRLGSSFGDVTGGVAAPRSFLITGIGFTPDDGMVTLTWTSRPGETYAVKISPDLADWSLDLDDSVAADAGETTTRTFDVSGLDQGEGDLFFRIERN